MATMTLNHYVPEIHVEFEKVDMEKHETESNSSLTDSDDEKKVSDIKLIPSSSRANYLRLDSGSSIGEEEDPAEISDELRAKIITQAEYYFSDENLKKDGFLLKHVKRNKEGFVNLKLLASFKKMKSLSRDYRVIGEALKDSKELVVNETGLKLRRVTPLPKELLDHVRVKHIVLTKIPNENPSMNYITEAFENHKDEVVSVRIIKPGKKFPNDLQSHFSRHPELREEVVAVVEFENPEIANEAIKTAFSNKYEGLKATLLELGPKQAKRINSAGNSDASANESDADRKSSGGSSKRNSRLLEVSGNEDNCASSASESEFSSFSSCNRRYNRSRGNSPATSPKIERREINNSQSKNNSRSNSRNPSPSVSPKSSPQNPRKNTKNNKNGGERKQSNNSHTLSPLVNGKKNSPNSSPEAERRSKPRSNSFNNERRNKSRGNSFTDEHKESSEARLSPWLQRRMMINESLKKNSPDMLKSGFPTLEIIRQPKGPDGSIGFSNHPLKKYVLVHAY